MCVRSFFLSVQNCLFEGGGGEIERLVLSVLEDDFLEGVDVLFWEVEELFFFSDLVSTTVTSRSVFSTFSLLHSFCFLSVDFFLEEERDFLGGGEGDRGGTELFCEVGDLLERLRVL